MGSFQEEAFEKGRIFEEYLERVIFNKSNYDLVEKTHSYDQNSVRYVESSMKPDFKFRSKATNQEFYVEAKFRSKYNMNEQVDILKPNQFTRFSEFNKKETPILLFIGIGGTPNNPDSVSMMPFSEIKHLEIYKSVLYNHRIDKHKSFDPTRITELINKPFATPNVNFENSKVIPKKSNNSLFWVYIGTFILIFLFLAYFTFFYQPEVKPELVPSESLRPQIESYYSALETNNTEALAYFINKDVDRWYKRNNVSLDYIKRDAETYNKKFPVREIDVDWSSFKQSMLPNGDFNVSYNVLYKIKQASKTEFDSFHLNIKAIWSKDLKIRSMYEERL